MTPAAQHTPTPWMIEENVNAGGIVHLGITNRSEPVDWMPCSITPMHMARKVDRANAAFIVRACNCHDALVAALEKIANPTMPHLMCYQAINMRDIAAEAQRQINQK